MISNRFIFYVVILITPAQSILRPSEKIGERQFDQISITNLNPEPQIVVPSRELVPPPFSNSELLNSALPPLPQSSTTAPSSISSFRQQQQGFPQQSQRTETFADGERIELLPPVEIPPETPIDISTPQGKSPAPFIDPIQKQPELNQFLFPPLLQQPLSFEPIVETNDFNQVSWQSNSGAFQTVPTKDPGLDCLGTCECPGDFTFVCGSNRFLYQNECALECDKLCNPDVIKVNIAHCSRKKK